jgi:hypothetical protein
MSMFGVDIVGVLVGRMASMRESSKTTTLKFAEMKDRSNER